ncbi:hypothetical protein R6Q59_032247 [Mikania micrantha]
MHHLCPRSRRHPSLSRGFAAYQALLSSLSVSVGLSAQQSDFVFGVLSDFYAFHRSTGNSLCPYHALRPIILDNTCILCITAAVGTELADAYSPDTVIASSPGKEVHDPWAFHLHESFIHIEFCGKPYSMKVVCTAWREIFHIFRDPPYNMG